MLNSSIDRVSEKVEYQIYLLVMFGRDNQVSGSERLHIVGDKDSRSNAPLEELVAGRNSLKVTDFTGYILKQRGDGKGWVVGNRYQDGKRIGVASLVGQKTQAENKVRLSSLQCWDVFLQTYDLDTGQVYSSQYLYSYCSDSSGDNTTIMMDPEGMGGSGSSSEIITTTLTDPCYSSTLSGLLANSFNMHAILQQILPNFNSNENLILIFTQESSGPSSQDAEMIPMGMVGSAKKYQITLNNDALSGAGQEYIAVTILHEVLHAHFHAAGINIDHHTNMANLYVNPMAQSLVNLFGMPLNIATALAWGGLYETDAWNNLSAGDKSFYSTANTLWRNQGNSRSSAPGTQCN